MTKTATAHRLKWSTSEEWTKGYSREWRALIGADEEYVISEGGVRIVGNTYTLEVFYRVTKGKIGAAKLERRNIGEALTLKEAKTLAQRHRDQTSGGLDLLA